MAGDWIKMRSNLRTHPKVVRMSSTLQCDALQVIGALWAVWSIADEHASVHESCGHLDGYTLSDMSTVIGFPGFAEAMQRVGWVSECEEHDGKCLIFPNFDTHNGQSAKRRAEDTERKRSARNGASRPQSVRKVSATKLDEVRTREEKRREEEEHPATTSTVVGGVVEEVLTEKTQKPVGTEAGRICRLLKQSGVADVNPGHLEFKAMVEAGVGDEAWTGAAQTAVSNGRGFAYMLGIVKRQMRDAAQLGSSIAAGVVSVSGQSADWRASRSGVEAKGVELGLGKWDQEAFEHGRGEMFARYEARVLAAAGPVSEKVADAAGHDRVVKLVAGVFGSAARATA